MDCGGIFAGAVLALAVSFLLIGFGVSLGLSLTSPYRSEGGSAATLLIGVLAAMLAAVAGGKHRDEGLGFDAAFQRR
ncbi:hypothetical protein [Rhabdonatronobacter sediminivivens]|nr:hypothetical protein [Rhabdonatronobacter sediminivivens]